MRISMRIVGIGLTLTERIRSGFGLGHGRLGSTARGSLSMAPLWVDCQRRWVSLSRQVSRLRELPQLCQARSVGLTTHGIAESAVTTNQIADAFLDCAVQRKNNLRAAFGGFFGSELKLPSAAALHYMG